MKATEKELLRYALADHAFREADALAEHLLSTQIPPDSHLFSSSVAGIVVSYCRPFMSATGLGSLPPAMAKFVGEKEEEALRESHELIIEARHKVAAHFDRVHVEAHFQSGKLKYPPSEVTFELRLDGYVVGTAATYLSPARLSLARQLFSFQLARVSKRLGSFAVDLLKTHKRLGTYTFTVK